jgi:hypothetical protein
LGLAASRPQNHIPCDLIDIIRKYHCPHHTFHIYYIASLYNCEAFGRDFLPDERFKLLAVANVDAQDRITLRRERGVAFHQNVDF